MFNNLRELILSMPTEKACREYLAKQRWVDGKATCPYCGHGKCYSIEDGERYKCASKECYKRFKITVGTIFEASNIPLSKWFTAIYLVTAHKKGISSYQLGKDIGVTQKSAWFMLHRVREVMRSKVSDKLNNVVEVDEVYIGGKVPNMSKSKRKKLRDEGNTYNTKSMVMGILERGGELKLIPVHTANNLALMQNTVKANVNKDADLVIDSHAGYTGFNKEFKSHEVVNHSSQEYVREGNIHTNSIEGAFSLLKRSIIGIYHQVTPKHLNMYCSETMFRYNLRDMKDADRFKLSLSMVEGRLTYKDLINSPTPVKAPSKITVPIIDRTTLNAKVKGRPVCQLFDGEIVGQFDSIKQAHEITGISLQNISKVLRGLRPTTGGYQWIYA